MRIHNYNVFSVDKLRSVRTMLLVPPVGGDRTCHRPIHVDSHSTPCHHAAFPSRGGMILHGVGRVPRGSDNRCQPVCSLFVPIAPDPAAVRRPRSAGGRGCLPRVLVPEMSAEKVSALCGRFGRKGPSIVVMDQRLTAPRNRRGRLETEVSGRSCPSSAPRTARRRRSLRVKILMWLVLRGLYWPIERPRDRRPAEGSHRAPAPVFLDFSNFVGRPRTPGT